MLPFTCIELYYTHKSFFRPFFLHFSMNVWMAIFWCVYTLAWNFAIAKLYKWKFAIGKYNRIGHIYNFAKWMCAKYPPRQYRIKCQMIENWIYEPMRKKKKRCVLCFPSRICWVNTCAKSAYEKETNDDDWWRVYINERKYTTRYIYLCFVFFFFRAARIVMGRAPRRSRPDLFACVRWLIAIYF